MARLRMISPGADLAGLLRDLASLCPCASACRMGAICRTFEVIGAENQKPCPARAVRAGDAALDWLQRGAFNGFTGILQHIRFHARRAISAPWAEAIMALLGAKQTIYCPPFPENGGPCLMRQFVCRAAAFGGEAQ